jgi:hypothetical protein
MINSSSWTNDFGGRGSNVDKTGSNDCDGGACNDAVCCFVVTRVDDGRGALRLYEYGDDDDEDAVVGVSIVDDIVGEWCDE